MKVNEKLCAVAMMLGISVGNAWGNDAVKSPGVVFDSYLKAIENADMVAVRGLISPEVERSDYVGCKPEMTNPACLEYYIESTVVRHRGRLTEVGRVIEGDLVISELELRSSWHTSLGVERVVGKDVVRVKNGKIVGFRFVPNFSDEQTSVFFGALGIGPRAVKR